MLSGLSNDVSLLQSEKKNSSSVSGDFADLFKQRMSAENSIGASQKTRSNSQRRSNKVEVSPFAVTTGTSQFASHKSAVDSAGKLSTDGSKQQKLDSTNEKSNLDSREQKNVVPENSEDKVAAEASATAAKEAAAETAATEKPVAMDATDGKMAVDEAVIDEQAEIKAWLDKNPELAEILASFSPEDKENLIQLLQRLSPQDLQQLSESPEKFKAELLELVNEIPDSEEKTKLQAMIESPEFAQLLDYLVAQDSLKSAVQLPTDATAAEKPATAAVMHNNPLPATADSEGLQGAEDALAGDKTNGSEKESLRAEQKAEVTNKAAATQASHEAPVSGEDESLRHEFKRVNNETVATESDSGESNSTGEETASAAKTVPASAGSASMTPTEVKSAVEEVARKFMSLLGDKNSSPASEKTGVHVYGAGNDSIKKAGASDHGAGNGSMGNGSSSQSGNAGNQTAAARQSAAAPATNVIFAEMLEKAEFLKTQNGSKILNLELSPEQLGKIEMELTSKDGNISAKLMAENAMSKAKLDELAPQIKEQLLSQGINLSEITVDISSRNPDERNSNQMFGGKNKSNRLGALGSEDAETIIRKNILPNLRRAALNIKAVDVTV